MHRRRAAPITGFRSRCYRLNFICFYVFNERLSRFFAVIFYWLSCLATYSAHQTHPNCSPI